MAVQGIIYDMDGTITKPHINWEKLRSAIGVPEDMFILGYIDSLQGKDRAKALKTLLDDEEEAARNSELNTGVREVIRKFSASGIKQAIATNNSIRSAKAVLEKHGLIFDHVVTRQDGVPKPRGNLLMIAAQRMGLNREEVVYVGDGMFDKKASEDAGIKFILLKSNEEYPDHDSAIRSFFELPCILGLE